VDDGGCCVCEDGHQHEVGEIGGDDAAADAKGEDEKHAVDEIDPALVVFRLGEKPRDVQKGSGRLQEADERAAIEEKLAVDESDVQAAQRDNMMDNVFALANPLPNHVYRIIKHIS